MAKKKTKNIWKKIFAWIMLIVMFGYIFTIAFSVIFS